MTPSARVATGALVVALSLSAPAALADQQLTAVPRDQYGTATVTIDQGQTASFANSDIDYHNVTATTAGADGNPLFASPTIGIGQSTSVAGTQYLTSGTYAFYCTIHPFMRGTIVVTSNGTPVPRPSQPTSSPSTPSSQAVANVAATTSLGAPKFVRARSGTRTLNLPVTASGEVSLTATLTRGNRRLGRKSASGLAAGQHVLHLRIGSAAPAGPATMALVIRDSAGHRAVLKETLQVPARLR
jgi:plastocyanin